MLIFGATWYYPLWRWFSDLGFLLLRCDLAERGHRVTREITMIVDFSESHLIVLPEISRVLLRQLWLRRDRRIIGRDQVALITWYAPRDRWLMSRDERSWRANRRRWPGNIGSTRIHRRSQQENNRITVVGIVSFYDWRPLVDKREAIFKHLCYRMIIIRLSDRLF